MVLETLYDTWYKLRRASDASRTRVLDAARRCQTLPDAARRCQADTVQDARAHGLPQIVAETPAPSPQRVARQSPDNNQTAAKTAARQRPDSGQTPDSEPHIAAARCHLDSSQIAARQWPDNGQTTTRQLTTQ
eukprot:7384946-Prymnesium_polylepis.1